MELLIEHLRLSLEGTTFSKLQADVKIKMLESTIQEMQESYSKEMSKVLEDVSKLDEKLKKYKEEFGEIDE